MHVMGQTLTPPPLGPFGRAAQPRLFPRVRSCTAGAPE